MPTPSPHLDYMRFRVTTAERGWAKAADITNTRPLAKLRRFLAKHPPARAHARR